MLRDNLEAIRLRISKAASLVKRNPEDITLVGVTKNIDISLMREAISLGIKELGENRVQEAKAKFDVFGHSIKWHLIGHLQSNKAKKASLFFDLIHSLDNIDLAKALDKAGEDLKKIVNVLVQVNTSDEKTKFGLKIEEAANFIKEVSCFDNLRVLGLMTMAPLVKNQEEARPFFRCLKELKEKIDSENIKNTQMKYLSMGMSQDFEVAIEEGSNMVRIGTAIFERKA
jgi:pyridoxal phosphate enzyme (YggS family)